VVVVRLPFPRQTARAHEVAGGGPGVTVRGMADAGRPGPVRDLPLPSRTERVLLAALLLVTALVVAFSAWQAVRLTPGAAPSPGNAGALAPAWASTPPAAPAPPPTTPTPEPARAPVLAFYGDWFVSGTEAGGLGPTGWPAIVSERVGAVGTEPHAVTDAGYVAVSDVAGDTFVTLAERQPEPAADVTIVFGGRNDYRASPAEITASARRMFDTIRATAPQTKLVVIGPAWTGADIPPELLPVRFAVRQAASDAGATFMDPLDGGWLIDGVGLIAGDGISPTDEGHTYLAGRIEPFVRALLGR
jgi:lysophospholipase L1-like esterase